MRIGSNGNVGIGGTTLTALFNVGSSDQFQVASSGNVTGQNITGLGNTHAFGGVAGSGDVTVTYGQGTTGFDNCTLRVRSANGLSSVHPTLFLNRNGTDFASLFTDGTDLFFEYPGVLRFRAGVNGTARFILSATGTVQTYNNIVTVSNGVPSEYAKVDSTTQAANIGQTLLYAVPASGAGLYRVSAYVVVTRQATTSSTMPKVQIDWTDSDSNTAVGPFDITLSSTAVNPAAGANSVGQNLLTTDTGTTAGTAIISARQSTNINYRTTGYASVGATTMQYAVHVKLEAL